MDAGAAERGRSMRITIFLCALLIGGSAMAEGASLRLKYDASLASINGGDGYKSDDNQEGLLAWGESYILMSLAAMYRSTGDPQYLATLGDHITGVLASTDKALDTADFSGKKRPCWQTGKYSDGQGYCWVVHSGMLTYPMVDYVAWTGDATVLSAVEAVVATHDFQWVDGPGAGEGYYRGDPAATFTSVAGKALPLNQMTAMGRTLLRLAAVTGNAVYQAKADKMAKYVRNRMKLQGNQLVWTYWGTAWSAGKGEDISHAAINVDFAVLAHQHEVVFTAADMKALASTLVGVHLAGGAVADVVGGGAGADNPSYRPQIGRWGRLAPYNPLVWPTIWNVYAGYNKVASGSLLLGIALLHEYAPAVGSHTFYSVDWAYSGATATAEAYGANLLFDPEPKTGSHAMAVVVHVKKNVDLAQWDGEKYHVVQHLGPTSDFVPRMIPYRPDIYFGYSGTAALYEFEDSFDAAKAVQVKVPELPAQPPAIQTTDLPVADPDVPWSATVESLGDGPILYRLVSSAGPTIDAVSGLITWSAPTATIEVTVRADNDAGHDVRTLTLTVTVPPEPMEDLGSDLDAGSEADAGSDPDTTAPPEVVDAPDNGAAPDVPGGEDTADATVGLDAGDSPAPDAAMDGPNGSNSPEIAEPSEAPQPDADSASQPVPLPQPRGGCEVVSDPPRSEANPLWFLLVFGVVVGGRLRSRRRCVS